MPRGIPKNRRVTVHPDLSHLELDLANTPPEALPGPSIYVLIEYENAESLLADKARLIDECSLHGTVKAMQAVHMPASFWIRGAP